MLAVFALAMGAAAAAQLLAARRERSGRISGAPIRWPRWLYAVLGVSIAVLLVVAVTITASKERPRVAQQPVFGATAQRLQSFESNRYAYWKVALRMFADHPLKGGGSHSFAVDWIQKRKIVDPAKDAHSLYIETAAELGLLGLAALALFLTGAVAAAGRARRLDPALAAGPIAAGCVWLVHTGLDWDWEMPAVSLIALVLMAALVAASEQPAVALSSSPAPPEASPPTDPPPPSVPAGAPAGA
jgi:O-antigen ligase